MWQSLKQFWSLYFEAAGAGSIRPKRLWAGVTSGDESWLAPPLVLIWYGRKSIASVAAHVLFALVLYRMIDAVGLISKDLALLVSTLAVLLVFVEHRLESGGQHHADSNRR